MIPLIFLGFALVYVAVSVWIHRRNREIPPPTTIYFTQADVELMHYQWGIPGVPMRGVLTVAAEGVFFVGPMGSVFRFHGDSSRLPVFGRLHYVASTDGGDRLSFCRGARELRPTNLDLEGFRAAVMKLGWRVPPVLSA